MVAVASKSKKSANPPAPKADAIKKKTKRKFPDFKKKEENKKSDKNGKKIPVISKKKNEKVDPKTKKQNKKNFHEKKSKVLPILTEEEKKKAKELKDAIHAVQRTKKMTDEQAKEYAKELIDKPNDNEIKLLFEGQLNHKYKIPYDLWIELLQKGKNIGIKKRNSYNEALKSAFFVKTRIGLTNVVSNVNIIIEKLANKYSDGKIKLKFVKGLNLDENQKKLLCIQRVQGILVVLRSLIGDENGKVKENIDELGKRIEKKDFDNEFVIDLSLEFISEKDLMLKCLAHYMFTEFAKNFDKDDFENLFNIMKKQGATILDDEEDEDDDDMQPITEEDIKALKNSKKVEEESDEEDEDDEMEIDGEDEDDDEEIIEQPNPKIVSALRKALGNAAVLDENSDEDIEMNDEELEKLDENLSEAMKKFLPQEKKLKRIWAEKFRENIAVLVEIVFSTVEIGKLLEFLPAVISTFVEAEEAKRDDLFIPLKKAVEGIAHRTDDQIALKTGATSAIELFKQVLEVVEKIHNSNLEAGLNTIAIFLVKIAIQKEKTKAVVVSEITSALKKSAKAETKSASFKIYNGLFTRFFEILVSVLPVLVDALENTKLKKQFEDFILIFARQDLIKKHTEFYEKAAEKLAKLYELKVEGGENKIHKTVKAFREKVNKKK